ncbi:hypothetical protein EIN_282600 [Entamoeba invadens IP1]|uniref:Uncharacterized protein n=1 Tax=Entamoeba invadens IP1 TaxID=370355 RepID=A0A0A1U2U4_ENTIV|nr:hypothetical protein EIN_282600 [Entamoeba invadens IP1]ELP85869.1 hypothetical protein EIN_282600 [Entamoeba invadens IP1]|eukprot:XP_004185215.1 hypothetical protein EIN_282600 [Entamoeba invadens IP1]
MTFLEVCIESANGKHCTLCATGAKYTSEGKCVCPTGTYLKDEKCEKCIDVNRKPVTGKMCEGSMMGIIWVEKACVKCALENNFEGTLVDGTCVCIEGYVYDTKTQTCDPCKDKLNEFCFS